MPPLPLIETIQPENTESVAETLRQAHDSVTPIYPIGGGTSLDYGLPAKREGLGLKLTNLAQVIDYPARDMTITVEAGITMEKLSDTLASESQRLPVDVPRRGDATLGGVIATNWNGPRRYGLGNLRDYVIGITAVDGRGRDFKGGGRVVKNVAGFDFCKLLTGSLGTLGVITEVTLKLKPIPEAFALLHCDVPDLDAAERLLAALASSATTPSAIELLGGPLWNNDDVLSDASDGVSSKRCHLLVGLEGTEAEVNWMQQQLRSEWDELGMASHRKLDQAAAETLWKRLVEFPDSDAPLVLKANVVPSGVTPLIEALHAIDPEASIQSHAGNGVVIARFAEIPTEGLSRMLVGRLQPLASSLQGHCTVLSNPGGSEMTHQCHWGGVEIPYFIMDDVKRQFDPHDILNPGRFVYQ